MKKFLVDMYNAPFLELMNFQNELCTVSEFHEKKLCMANFIFYLPIPDILRRCYFLQASEKQVLFELMSWANSNKESEEVGYCSVPEPIIRGNVNLAKSTIKKAIKALREMGFIEVKRYFNGTNRYKINSLSLNPYVLLSEYVHWNRQRVVANWGSNQYMFEKWKGDALPYDVHSYTEASLEFVNKSNYYMPFIKQIKASYGNNFLEQYSLITSNAEKKIYEIFEEMYYRLKGRT